MKLNIYIVTCLFIFIFQLNVLSKESDSTSILVQGKTASGETVYKGLTYNGGTSGNADSIIDVLFDTSKSKGIKFTKGGSFKGNRSRKNIIKTVFKNLANLRYAYNKRLRDNPALGGKILVQISVADKGNVVDCKVAKTTMKDKYLPKIIIEEIWKWDFGEIDYPGDTSVILYPFVFSQNK